jgi:hypothetical protein
MARLQAAISAPSWSVEEGKKLAPPREEPSIVIMDDHISTAFLGSFYIFYIWSPQIIGREPTVIAAVQLFTCYKLM